MNKLNRYTTVFLLVGLLFLLGGLLLTGVALASAGNGYEITWFTHDGGGSMDLAGGDYQISSTIGQPDAATSTGGAFNLTGGFWGVAQSVQLGDMSIYLPVLQK